MDEAVYSNFMDVQDDYYRIKVDKSCENVEDTLPVISFHELRHTSASILIAQGMEVTAVAKRLGHADASTTLRVYAHSFEERDRTASDMLENVLIKREQDNEGVN